MMKKSLWLRIPNLTDLAPVIGTKDPMETLQHVFMEGINNIRFFLYTIIYAVGNKTFCLTIFIINSCLVMMIPLDENNIMAILSNEMNNTSVE